MRTIGFFLLITGITSFLLIMADAEFVVFSILDRWGEFIGLLLRMAIMILGIFLMLKKPGAPENRFPELREIHEIELEKLSHKKEPTQPESENSNKN